MPDEFPVEEFTRFMAGARRVLLNPSQSPAWQEFAGASNLIGWRFRASFEDWQTYKRSIVSIGEAANHDQLYQREGALFGMFVCGVSCIESTAYALAALVSHPAVLSLPFGPYEQRACSPRRLAQWLSVNPTAHNLTQALTELVASHEWAFWVDLRNRMTHRSSLPRIINGAVGGPAPPTRPLSFAATSSTPHVDATLSEFDALHRWLAESLRRLLVEGNHQIDRLIRAHN